MKNLRKVVTGLAAVVAFSGLGALVAVGCGGDDTAAALDGGPDGANDVALGVDVGTGDSAEVDGGTDTGKDSTPPPFDGGPLALDSFARQINEAYCQRSAVCCAGSVSQWDVPGCVDLFDSAAVREFYQGVGGQNPLVPYVDGGHIVFDPVKARACVDEIYTFECSPTSSAKWLALTQSCLAAAKGDIPSGSAGCRGSAECVPPAHCDPADAGGADADAGPGTCAAPRAVGAPCGPNDSHESEAQCGYLRTGIPNFCDAVTLTGKTQSCQPQLSLGANCIDSLECQSGICAASPNDAGQFVCSATRFVATPGLCELFQLKDAGGGGG